MILKNLAGLEDAQTLEDFELEMTALRAEEAFPDGQYDPAHYQSIHHHLFQDVYDWAGQYRTVRTAKGGAAFCYPEHIDAQMNSLFDRLCHAPFTGADDPHDFVSAAADFLGELNAIHAFREGNGRCQLSFVAMLAERAGFPMDMAKLRAGPMLAAMIASFSGDLKPLEQELAICLIDEAALDSPSE